MSRRLLHNQFVQLLFFLVCGGLVSMALKFEVTWDFANYHYYNPWAFLNDNQSDILALAGFHSFFNPLIDLPLYYLITYFNDYPNFIYFVQGMSFGLLAFALFLIEKIYLSKINLIVGALIVGLTGYAVFFQIGTSSNEIQVSVFIMFSFLFLVKGMFIATSQRRFLIFIAGILAGTALGLKYTVVTYCISLFLSLAVISERHSKIENLSFFVLGGSIGFLCVNGFWMWHLWNEFHSPVFPFLNKVFQSEYWADNNYSDRRFIPENIWKFLIFPFNHRRNGDSFLVWDYRLAFVFLSLAVLCFLKKRIVDPKFKFIICFWIISYFIWICFFSISRYSIPLELVGIVILIKTFELMIPENKNEMTQYNFLFYAIFFFLLITPFVSKKYGCRNCELDGGAFTKFVEVERGIHIPDGSLLLFYYDPGAALLPYFSRDAEKLKGVYMKKQSYKEFCNGIDVFSEFSYWQNKRQAIIDNHKGVKVAVVAYQSDEIVNSLLKNDVLLKGMVCRKFRSNIMPWYHFCIKADQLKDIFSDD